MSLFRALAMSRMSSDLFVYALRQLANQPKTYERSCQLQQLIQRREENVTILRDSIRVIVDNTLGEWNEAQDNQRDNS